MRTRSSFWRFTLFTSLGLCPTACGGRSFPNNEPVGDEPSACVGSKPHRGVNGVDTGLAECDNGLVHRPSADVECTSDLPRPDSEIAEQVATAHEASCSSDNDCTAKPHGHCSAASGQQLRSAASGQQLLFLSCRYGCLTDADCENGNVCVCGDPVGECVPSNCTQDSDCGEGLLCAEWMRTSGCAVDYSLLCQTVNDTCAVDSDCGGEGRSEHCDGASGTRVCVENDGVVCGRPFLVNGVERLAPLTGATFAEHVASRDPSSLEEAVRLRAAEHWAHIGLMEHASIAAFARFALQLLHLGAPLPLLEAAQRAMLDETVHAKLAFGIASELNGSPVGPGQLCIDSALMETSLEDIVRLVVREGCIGETVAAMEAAEARAYATDPAVCGALDTIQKDETAHAQLAWQFVQWALTHGRAGAALHSVVADEFAQAIARESAGRPESPELHPAALAHVGVLSRGTRAAVRAAALAEVVAPCAAELLRATSAAPTETAEARSAVC